MRVDDSTSLVSSTSSNPAKVPVDSFHHHAAKEAVSTETSPKKKPYAVGFDSVEVRRYRLILGDNPYTEVPLSLGWDYDADSVHVVSVDAHEDHKKNNPENYVSAQYMEPMDVSARQARLRSVGYTNQQIRLEERKRRISVLQEWSYRCNREDTVICTVPKGACMFKRYIL